MANWLLPLLCLSSLPARLIAADVCEGGCGNTEESALLQAPVQAHQQSSRFPCVHGHPLGKFCICTLGWGGRHCEKPSEMVKEPKPVPVPGETCGEDFEVFPYGQQDLWGTSYEGWEECAGKQQSPINIETRLLQKVKVPQPLDINFGKDTDLTLKNNGHNLQVPGSFGTVTIDGEVFTSPQFHFHAPSEHTVNGQLAAAEMHIVSLNAAGSGAAVVGIMFDIGAPNKCLENVLAGPIPRSGCRTSIGSVDLSCFGYQFKGPWWNYQGSLTTPPCNEIVNWNVLQRRATISKEQLDALSERYELVPGNARKPQPLNGRQVVLKKPRCKWGAALEEEEAQE